MKKIALYGYGKFGKRASESFRFYWGEEYEVTAIFDTKQTGEKDPFWNLRVISPEKIKEEYDKGTFEAVFICIHDRTTQQQIIHMITALGIPRCIPGNAEDFTDAEFFPQDKETGICVSRDQYSFHVFKNMYGAVSDSNIRWCFFLFDENGRLYVGTYKKYLNIYKRHLLQYPFRLKDPLPEKVYLEGDWCVIAKMHSLNYWHLTCETADRVYLLEKAGYKGKYIFNDFPYIRELLQMLGISSERLVDIKELEYHKVYVFERLFDIDYQGGKEYECSIETVCELAGFLKQKLDRNESSPKKIYVKRIGIRKLLNAEEIAVKNGFSIIIPEDCSVREQMELFHNADIVLCPHGANSTNCLYMRKGTVFAEIFSDRWYMGANEDFCKANGVSYLHMFGKALSNDDQDRDADYIADGNDLQDFIQKAEQTFAAGNPDPEG